MFNHLESLGTQESPVKVDLLHLDLQTRTADAAAGKTTANIAVGGTATRRSKRNAKAGVIPCKHRLFMVC